MIKKGLPLFLFFLLLPFCLLAAESYEYSVYSADDTYEFKSNNKSETHHELTLSFSGGAPTAGLITISATPRNSTDSFDIVANADITQPFFYTFDGDVGEWSVTTTGITGITSFTLTDTASSDISFSNWYGIKSLSQILSSPNFELAVSAGLVDGLSTVDKFGRNQDVDIATAPEDVWEFGGLYNYDTFGTAPILYISSSDALDVGQTIDVQGLDITGAMVNQIATTNGQNNVTLTTPLWRVFRMVNESDVGNDLAGILYCHTDPTPTAGVPAGISVRSIIDDGNNQTLMALYTIPLGKVGFLYRGELGIGATGNAGALAENADVQYRSRRLGKVFTVKKAVNLMIGGNPIYQDERPFPDIVPDLVDIKITVESVTDDNTKTWATFDILLVDESKLEPAFLQAIGQQGY